MMHIVRFNELREIKTAEGTIKSLFASETLNMIHVTIPAGLREQPHPHRTPENIMVLKGAVRLNAASPVLLQEGDMAHIPAGYTVGMESDGEAEALLILSPSDTGTGNQAPNPSPPIVRHAARPIRMPEQGLQLCNYQ